MRSLRPLAVVALLLALTCGLSAAAFATVQPMIAAGYNHGLHLRSDGTVWSWGANDADQLGPFGGNYQLKPRQIPDLTNIKAVAAGDKHSLALDESGVVWAWGANDIGQLGAPTTVTKRAAPAAVAGLPVIVAIAAGRKHTLCLDASGYVWSFGNNWDSQLGERQDEFGNGADWEVPSKVLNISGVTAIAAGERFSVVRTSDGRAWAWGATTGGLLGNGEYDVWSPSYETPQPVQTGPGVPLTNVAAISANGSHTLAVLADGKVYAWGVNANDQISPNLAGNDQPYAAYVLAPPIDPARKPVAAAAGVSFSLILLADGAILGWDPTLSPNQTGGATMTTVIPNLAGVVSISAGDRHALAAHADDNGWAWGSNSFGQLGSGESVGVERQQPKPLNYTLADVMWAITSMLGTVGGSVDPIGLTAVPQGGSKTFHITATPGYRTANVVVTDAQGTRSLGPVTEFTFTNVTTNCSLQASFYKPDEYAINAIDPLGGEITPYGTRLYAPGSSATYTITPYPGMFITEVRVNGQVVPGAPGQYTFSDIKRDHEISATFAPLSQLKITATVTSAGGSMTPLGEMPVNMGDSMTFTLQPDPGHKVKDVLVNGVSVGAVTSYAFTNIDRINTISASFGAIRQVTASISTASGVGPSGGTLSPAGIVEVAHGGSLTFNVTPKPGHAIGSIKFNGVELARSPVVTVGNITANSTFEVAFRRKPSIGVILHATMN